MDQNQQLQALMRLLAAQGGRGGHVEQSYPYYSHVRFQWTPTLVSSTTTWTLQQGSQVQAFNYAQGAVITGAGFPSATIATPLDTNLIKQGETIGGETVKVYGLSFLLDTDADAELTRLTFANVSVRIGLNGDQNIYNFGPLSMMPGGGGLHGIGRSDAVESPLLDRYAMVGALSNGLPGTANYFRLPTPILWKPPGSSDASLTITCKVERTVTFTSVNRTASAPASGSTGTQAYTAPTSTNLGTYTGGWFRLHSVTKSARSSNA